MPALDPRRADLAVAGVILVDTILRRLGADDLTLCDLALREGLILDYIRRNRRHIAHADSIPDVRRRSVLELAERCHYDADHSKHVVRLALAIFDQSRDGLLELLLHEAAHRQHFAAHSFQVFVEAPGNVMAEIGGFH